MDGDVRRDWNDGQPRAEKRVNKFAGCRVNGVEKFREFSINVGAQEIFWQPTSPPLEKLAIFWSDFTVQVW